MIDLKKCHQPSVKKWQDEVQQIKEQIKKLRSDLDNIKTFPRYCRREEIKPFTGEDWSSNK